jgi:hypothetical protein
LLTDLLSAIPEYTGGTSTQNPSLFHDPIIGRYLLAIAATAVGQKNIQIQALLPHIICARRQRHLMVRGGKRPRAYSLAGLD